MKPFNLAWGGCHNQEARQGNCTYTPCWNRKLSYFFLKIGLFSNCSMITEILRTQKGQWGTWNNVFFPPPSWYIENMAHISTKSLSSLYLKSRNMTWLLYLIKNILQTWILKSSYAPGMDFKDCSLSSLDEYMYYKAEWYYASLFLYSQDKQREALDLQFFREDTWNNCISLSHSW